MPRICFAFFVTKTVYFPVIIHIVILFYRYLLGNVKVFLTSKKGGKQIYTTKKMKWLLTKIRILLRRPSSLVFGGKMAC